MRASSADKAPAVSRIWREMKLCRAAPVARPQSGRARPDHGRDRRCGCERDERRLLHRPCPSGARTPGESTARRRSRHRGGPAGPERVRSRSARARSFGDALDAVPQHGGERRSQRARSRESGFGRVSAAGRTADRGHASRRRAQGGAHPGAGYRVARRAPLQRARPAARRQTRTGPQRFHGDGDRHAGAGCRDRLPERRAAHHRE